MIFNDEVIFIHIGKTAGMSCTRYLLHNLKRPVYNCHKDALIDSKLVGLSDIIPCIDMEVSRHSTLAEALQYIKRFNGKQLDDFKKVFAVIRHPFTLEYSFYSHLRKPHVKKFRKNQPELLELAAGEFIDFVKKGGYHRTNISPDQFFRLSGEIPHNVELIRFEEIVPAFVGAVAPFIKTDSTYQFPTRNKTQYTQEKRGIWANLSTLFGKNIHKTHQQRMIESALTDEVKELIYQKYKYMFDSGLYSRSL
ncbi:MAG: hypothetical protein M8357_02765 [Desulfobulbaceae bacterium]|nr:hypothetical protein [Desulfobulbaceae bacterium]